jgi:translation initiation factor IF-3
LKQDQKTKLPPKNEGIRVPHVTLISDEGEKIENCDTKEALKMAYDRGLDLVLVAPNINPPVAKIMDWGKYKYELSKKLEQSKKQSKIIELKEIRLRPKTDSHDIEIKLKKIKEFLEKGHKVKITMMFKGREAAFINKGRDSMNSIISSLAELAKQEEQLKYQFKRLSTTLAPIVSQQKK